MNNELVLTCTLEEGYFDFVPDLGHPKLPYEHAGGNSNSTITDENIYVCCACK